MSTLPHYEGDLIEWLLEGRINLLVHQCNCFHTMGAGIARILAKRFPEVTAADRATVYGDRSKMGTATIALPKELGGKGVIGNIYSQFRYGGGCDTEYDTIAAGIRDAVRQARGVGINSVKLGVPYRYGAGLGGGDWERVKAALAELPQDLRLRIVVLPQFAAEARQSAGDGWRGLP